MDEQQPLLHEPTRNDPKNGYAALAQEENPRLANDTQILNKGQSKEWIYSCHQVSLEIGLRLVAALEQVGRCTHSCLRGNAGLLLVMLSQLFIALMNTSVKLLTALDPRVSVFEVIGVRMAFTFVFCQVYLIWKGIPNPLLGPKGVRKLLVCRGLFGFCGLFGMFYSLQYLSMGDTTALLFVGPFVTGIAGHLILGEAYSHREAIAALCSLFGVILIARPPALFGEVHGAMTETMPQPGMMKFNRVPIDNSISGGGGYADPGRGADPAERLRAVAAVIIGVSMAAGAMLSLRAIGKRAHAMHSMSYFSLWSCIASVVGMVMFQEPVVAPMNWRWTILLLAISVFGFLAQILLTLGLQRETAVRGTMGVYVQVVYSMALQKVVFGTVPGTLSLLGTGIIITCAAYVVLVKQSGQVNTENSHANLVPESRREDTLEEGLLSSSGGESTSLNQSSGRVHSP